MTDRELMQQALEALEFHVKNADEIEEIDLVLVTALRERLAQPEQEHIIDCPRCGHCCPADLIAAAERERCAEICDSIAANAVLGTANECARAIRNATKQQED